MDFQKMFKYTVAFFAGIGFIANPGFILFALLLIFICNIDKDSMKYNKKMKEEVNEIKDKFGEDFEKNPNFKRQLELAQRTYYYRLERRHKEAYREYLGE